MNLLSLKSEKQLQSFLSEKGFIPVEVLRVPDGKSVRSYVIKVKKEGILYTLKYFDSPYEEALERFKNEIKILKNLKSVLPKRFSKMFPQIKWYSLNSKNPYYIYPFFEGEPIGVFLVDYGIKWGYFDDRNFDYFLDFLTYISFLAPSKISKKVNLSKWGEYRVKKELRHYFGYNKDLISDELKNQLYEFLENHTKDVMNSMVFSHKDLYPENILIKQKFSKNLFFIDFEHFSYVPIGFDAAFLYLLFWREEYWRGKIYSHYYTHYNCHNNRGDKRKFELSFRYCLAVIAVRMLYQLEVYGDKNSSDYSNAHLAFKKYLSMALSGKVTNPDSVKFLVNKDDLQKIMSSYNLGKISKYVIFYASKGNTVAKVTAENGQNYIIRLYSRRRSRSLIKRELRILEYLSSRSVPTYRVIDTGTDKQYKEFRFYGIKQKVTVLSYVNGSRITHKWADKKAANSAGALLKKIHDLNVIHGDYSKENVLYTKNRVTGIIDFEWGRFSKSKSEKLNDLAKAITLWIVDVRTKNISEKEFILNFLEGYYDRKPSKKDLTEVLQRVVDKIEEERDIFVNLSGIHTVKKMSFNDRFDNAINVANEILEEE